MKEALFEKNEQGYFNVKFYVDSESDFYFELSIQKFHTTATFSKNERKFCTFLAITFVKMRILTC
jgi:hypothetical protein